MFVIRWQSMYNLSLATDDKEKVTENWKLQMTIQTKLCGTVCASIWYPRSSVQMVNHLTFCSIQVFIIMPLLYVECVLDLADSFTLCHCFHTLPKWFIYWGLKAKVHKKLQFLLVNFLWDFRMTVEVCVMFVFLCQ